MNSNTTASENHLNALNPSKYTQITKYFFDAGTKNKSESFWLVIAKYQNIESSKKAFQNLRNLSGNVQTSKDKVPGLTYSNDYVVRDGKRIIWLNSGCLYSEQDHLQLSEILKRHIPFQVSETINCKCGEVECL
ncbi:hypothetical protein [Flavobacterium selenitireducens]|uniref:hypothetical protein n=1 Tax=Flavobacterium selenitireducens TaxID=2722704 RepID=UPI00168B3E4C|nr:hypothetical protein [Flavobacterium selenitireducens]MBD3584077.1 hypothetical protein [Flavobacterium selenitireducens]